MRLFKTQFVLSLILLALTSGVEAAQLPTILQGEFYMSSHKHELLMRNTANTFFGFPVIDCKNYYDRMESSKIDQSVVTVQLNSGPRKLVVNIQPEGVAVGDTTDNRVWIMHNEQIHNFKTRESIGGVAPYMTKYKVLQMYGEPTQRTANYKVIDSGQENPIFGRYKVMADEEWFYANGNWRIKFLNGGVTHIRLPKGSTKRFDNSGIGTNNSIYDFCRILGVEKHKFYDFAFLNDRPFNNIGYLGTGVAFSNGEIFYEVCPTD